MAISITQKFPVYPNKYLAEIQIESAGSIGHAKIKCQVRGVTSSWDWYVNNPGCAVNLYIDGTNVYSGDLSSWGAKGSGLNGVNASSWVTLSSSVKVNKNSKLKLTIDCSKKPVIHGGYGDKAIGYLTIEQTPKWSDVITFTVAPTITSIYNNNKYNNQAGISASMNDISIGINTGGDAPTDWQYQDPKDGKWKTMPSNPFSITGLSAGTSYTVNTYVANEAGHAYKDITIRTRYDKPKITDLKIVGDVTTDMNISWSADRECQQISYKIREANLNYAWNEGWSDLVYINLYNTKSGSFNINGLIFGHSYEVHVSILSTSTYDALWSDSYSIGAESIQPAFLITPLNFIFGEDFVGYRNNPSGKANIIEFYIASSMTKFLTVDYNAIEKNQGDLAFDYGRTNNINWGSLFNDNLWDRLYKSLEGTSNILPLKVKIGTITDSDTIYQEYDAVLTLTGKMKTMRVYANDTLNRIQAWVEEQSMMTEAVAWIGGPDSKPYRSI